MAYTPTESVKNGGAPYTAETRTPTEAKKVETEAATGAPLNAIGQLNQKPQEPSAKQATPVAEDVAETPIAGTEATSAKQEAKKSATPVGGTEETPDVLAELFPKNGSSKTEFDSKAKANEQKLTDQTKKEIAEIPDAERMTDSSVPSPEPPNLKNINDIKKSLQDQDFQDVEQGRTWYVKKFVHEYDPYTAKWGYKWRPDVRAAEVPNLVDKKLFDLGSVGSLWQIKDGVQLDNVGAVLRSKTVKHYETTNRFDNDSVFATVPGGNPAVKLQVSTGGEIIAHNFKFANAQQKHKIAEATYMNNRNLNPGVPVNLTGSTDYNMRMYMAFNYKFDESGKLVDRKDEDKVKTWYNASDSNIAKWKNRLEKEHKGINTLEASPEERKIAEIETIVEEADKEKASKQAATEEKIKENGGNVFAKNGVDVVGTTPTPIAAAPTAGANSTKLPNGTDETFAALMERTKKDTPPTNAQTAAGKMDLSSVGDTFRDFMGRLEETTLGAKEEPKQTPPAQERTYGSKENPKAAPSLDEVLKGKNAYYDQINNRNTAPPAQEKTYGSKENPKAAPSLDEVLKGKNAYYDQINNRNTAPPAQRKPYGSLATESKNAPDPKVDAAKLEKVLTKDKEGYYKQIRDRKNNSGPTV